MPNNSTKHVFPTALAANIKVLVLDVDGVLTDGGLYYDAHSQAMKRFHVHDGFGIRLLMKAGIHVAVITGLDSPAVAQRIKDLGIADYYAGFLDKRDCLDKIRQKYALQWENMAYLGDDWVDLAVLHLVGLPLAVANGQPEVKDIAKYITTASGGNGAVREVVRNILMAQNKYDEALATWSRLC